MRLHKAWLHGPAEDREATTQTLNEVLDEIEDHRERMTLFEMSVRREINQ